MSRCGNSSTVGTFIKIRKTLERHNGAMYLWNLSAGTRRILSGMHLLDYFEVDHDAALETLREHVLQRIPPSDKKFITILKQRVQDRARGSSDE
jgi:hypothetical protein